MVKSIICSVFMHMCICVSMFVYMCACVYVCVYMCAWVGWWMCSFTLQISEKAPAGTIIGTFSVADEDKYDTHIFTLSSDDGGRFKIQGRQLIKTGSINYETKQKHTIKVKVTDNGTAPSALDVSLYLEMRT